MLIFDLLGGKTAIFASIKAIIGLTIPANPQTGLLFFLDVTALQVSL